MPKSSRVLAARSAEKIRRLRYEAKRLRQTYYVNKAMEAFLDSLDRAVTQSELLLYQMEAKKPH
ncbi:MAG: hypothetical protein INF43_03285 [Alphaproteobacteria bacterium]|nr:hypothetical protein [Alphaproteobacteria bacterium]